MSVIRLWLLLFVCVCAYFQIGLEMIVWQDRPPTKWLIINNNTIKYLPAEWQRKKIINHSIAPTYYPVIYLSICRFDFFRWISAIFSPRLAPVQLYERHKTSENSTIFTNHETHPRADDDGDWRLHKNANLWITDVSSLPSTGSEATSTYGQIT